MIENILKWLANGSVGLSSKNMALVALGAEMDSYKSYPRDPDDLNRCILLVKQVPEIQRHFTNIADQSPEWWQIIQHWDELVELFHEEAGPDWSKKRTAPETYKHMRKLLSQASETEGASA